MSWFGSSTRKTTIFYVVLIAMASLVVGMVIASRLDLSPTSSAQTLAIPSTNSAPLSGPVDATTFRNIAKAQSPMVVSIRTESRQRTQDLSEFFGGDDLLERFFGPGRGRTGPRGQQAPRRQQPRITQAAGSGFIINKEGFIITNNHVVEGASKIAVLFFEDSDEYEAKIVGRDPLTDSALLQLVEKPNRPLPEAKFGDSSQMEPGDWVMAIGNPFSLAHTVSVGVISATSRPFPVATPAQRERAADRRGDQSRQLGRTAAEPSRRSDRREHGDLQQRRRDGRRRQHRHRLRDSHQHDSRRAARTALRQDHARPYRRLRASGVAGGGRRAEPEGSSRRDGGAGAARSGRHGGHRTRRRHRRVQRQTGDPQRGAAGDRGGHGAGHDGAGESDSRRQGADVQRARRRAQPRSRRRIVRPMRARRAATRAPDSALR